MHLLPSCPACMAALMRWACQRMTSQPTAMPVAHAPPHFPRCSRPMPRATLTLPTPPCAPRWPRCTAWHPIASWWRAARLNSSTASPPGPGCTAAPRCCCRPTATVTTPRRRRPMGWRCCDAVPRLRWAGRARTRPHPPPCTGPASPPARWARWTVCCLHGTAPRRPAVCGCWTAPTARCGLQHLAQTQSCPHPPGNCGRPTNPWA